MFYISKSKIEPTEYEHQFYMTGNSGSFTTSLLDAFHRADSQNFAKLSSAFPEYGYVVAKEFKPEHIGLFKVVDE